MKKLAVSFVFFLSIFTFSFAQQHNWRPTAIQQQPNYILKYNMGGLIKSDGPFFSFTLEHHLTDNFYLEHGAGFTRHRSFFNPFGLNNRTVGYELNSEIKYYFGGIVKESQNYHIGLSLTFQQTFSNRTEWFERASSAFRQQFTYTRQKSIGGIYATFGGTRFLTKRIILSSMIGGGYVLTNRENVGVPDDAIPTQNQWFWGGGRNIDLTPLGNSGKFGFLTEIKIGIVLVDQKKK